jgi:hypothetical protein
LEDDYTPVAEVERRRRHAGEELERYEAAFREDEIDDTILPRSTAEDLKDLGVSIVGYRRKLLDAIAARRSDTEPILSLGSLRVAGVRKPSQ